MTSLSIGEYVAILQHREVSTARRWWCR